MNNSFRRTEIVEAAVIGVNLGTTNSKVSRIKPFDVAFTKKAAEKTNINYQYSAVTFEM